MRERFLILLRRLLRRGSSSRAPVGLPIIEIGLIFVFLRRFSFAVDDLRKGNLLLEMLLPAPCRRLRLVLIAAAPRIFSRCLFAPLRFG